MAAVEGEEFPRTMEIRYLYDRLFQFTQNLEQATQTKYARALRLLEQYGQELRMPFVKRLDAQLFELRVRGRQEVRMFFTFTGYGVLLLHGYLKKSQKIPFRE